MKRTFTILTVFLFIFSFYSCSSDDNGDLKKADKEQESKEDFTSEKYIKSLLIGKWKAISYQSGSFPVGYDEGEEEVYIFNSDNTYSYSYTLSNNELLLSYKGTYKINPATESDNAVLLLHDDQYPDLETAMVIELLSYDEGIVEVKKPAGPLSDDVYYEFEKQ